MNFFIFKYKKFKAEKKDHNRLIQKGTMNYLKNTVCHEKEKTSFTLMFLIIYFPDSTSMCSTLPVAV